jgi:hypothetical protein
VKENAFQPRSVAPTVHLYILQSLNIYIYIHIVHPPCRLPHSGLPS